MKAGPRHMHRMLVGVVSREPKAGVSPLRL